jgi:hypothetical protein
MRHYDVGDLHACWPWYGPSHRQGYGRIDIGSNYIRTRRKALAHRVGWEVFVGPIPEGMMVLHTCDFTPCMNPSHWYLGTQLDNMRDRKRRGRYTQARRADGRYAT